MANLERQLGDWVGQGLLTPQQGAAIAAYEAARPSGRWVYLSFMGLGATALGIGLISLVAANWGDIPPLLQLAAAFAVLFALTWAAWRRLEQGGETLLVVQLFATLACLGLISQIYHTGGKLADALLFWSIITLPAVSLARGRLTPMLWLSTFFGAGFFWLLETHWLTQSVRDDLVFGLLLALPYVNGWLAGVLFRDHQAGFGWTLRQWAIFSGMVVVGLGDIALTTGHGDYFHALPVVPAALLALATVGYLLFQRRMVGLARNLAVVTLLLHLAQMVLQLAVVKAPMTSFLLVVAMVGLAAALAALLGVRRLFHGLILLLGLRFLVAYLDAAGGLAFTGAGLIFAGMMILGAVFVWRRHGSRLLAWLEGLS